MYGANVPDDVRENVVEYAENSTIVASNVVVIRKAAWVVDLPSKMFIPRSAFIVCQVERDRAAAEGRFVCFVYLDFT